MKINSFKFSNHKEDWHIKRVYFDDLNLLVGASGVGKTRILRALDLICDVAKDRVRGLDDLEWEINFSHSGKEYRWDLKSSVSIDEALSSEQGQAEISYEKLIQVDGTQETEIFSRTDSESKLNNEKLPKLKRTESAITLLSEEDSILPVREAFKRFIFNEISQEKFLSLPFDLDNISILEPEIIDLDSFKKASANTPTVLKAYFLQKFFPEIFNEIKLCYLNIFPNINDVRIGVDKESRNRHRLSFEITESDSDDWIPQQRISSGMFRTLTYLVEILAAPEDSVIAIDEFENSLGINCMPDLTDFILDHSLKLQFIFTSHHPYIINNIPWETWQIVGRNGNQVKVRKATEIHQLKTASSLDKFTQLVNLLANEGDVA